MSLRRYLAGPVSFGLNVGLAFVAGELVGWDPSALPEMTLFAWVVGLGLAATSLKFSLPIVHTGTAGALLVASAFATSTSVWALPLAGAVVALALARFASVGLASRWLSWIVGLLALGLLALTGYRYATGSLDLGGDGTSGIELVEALGLLLALAVLGVWPSGGDEEE